MKVALVNPPWTFQNSIYFGCREPHLPLELGATAAHLTRAGHQTLLIDAPLQSLDLAGVVDTVGAFRPDVTLVTTAPTYLFWRCAQPELRVPRAVIDGLADRAGFTVAVGPHGSATPAVALRKLGVDCVVRGECEEVIPELLDASSPKLVSGVAFREGDQVIVTGGPRAATFKTEPALQWDDDLIQRHSHHHHRFNGGQHGPGAEVEASRGCPYSCSFCAKIDFRDRYRRRALGPLLDEIDRLIAQGVTYVYFVDEIFLPDADLLEALCRRPVQFGVQTRIDLWKPDQITLLGRAGCVSIEAGVESLTVEGRASLDKRCKLSTDELAALLIKARSVVPFVQANLIGTAGDDPAMVTDWRARLRIHGVWANEPVPLYPYPSSPDYRRLFGVPDDAAWERAHAHYLGQFGAFSDIQDQRPLPLEALEAECR